MSQQRFAGNSSSNKSGSTERPHTPPPHGMLDSPRLNENEIANMQVKLGGYGIAAPGPSAHLCYSTP